MAVRRMDIFGDDSTEDVETGDIFIIVPQKEVMDLVQNTVNRMIDILILLSNLNGTLQLQVQRM